MPTYEYECIDCGNSEEMICSVNSFPDSIRCHVCGAIAQKVINFGGSILSDTPAWIDQTVRNQIQGDNEKPIETRAEYKKYLREHNIVEKN